VFVDELEQAFQRGESGDSGVSNRIFKRVMEFMSNTGNRGRVLFLAASNRPDLMDAALKRPGRFDKKIIFEVPGTPQRADILTVMLRRYAEGFKVKPKEVNELADQTEGWTGAEIELLTTKACELAARNGGPHVVTYPHMQKAMKFIRRSTKQTEFMTAVALLECDDLEYLPASYQANFEERLTWAEKIVAQHRQANRR
jgi:transitional endoplasmic reticulum ATPase